MEIFKLFGTIALNNQDANDSMDETTSKAESLQSKIGNAFEKIGSAAIKVGQVVATGLAAGSAAIGAITKSAVDSYAEYEQLVGGVETLFKTSADKVKEYAANAYQTAGLSANEYMETATSFSASLIQSLASHTSESYESSMEALDRHYEAVEDSTESALELLKESQEKEVEAFEAATDAKIALIDKQYKENLKLIDEEKYNQLKAIDAQIDKLNDQTEAEKAAIEKKKQQQKIASLEEKIAKAKDDDARKKAEQDLADYLEELEQKERENKRKEQIAALKDQQQAIKDEATAKKEALQEQYATEKEAIKSESAAQLKELKKAQQDELKALEKFNESKLSETKRYVERQKEILESSKTSVNYTAETYQKAAEYANQAIIDMSDNANKMGTSMEMIQNAYQGFAKQNYTMLDNLKLGYGGTKEEMERLLEDASKLTNQEYDISSFADIVDAIHAIQVEMGITGTTASEASTTIQGSLLATKAAWQNLLTGFADGNQDMGVLLDNFVGSATTAAKNLVPRIAQILSGISDAMAKIMPVVSAQLPVILAALLPGVISGAVALVNGLVSSLPTILQIFLEQIPFIITEISTGLIQAFPILFETVKKLFVQIWDYIAVELLGTEADFESSLTKIRGFFEDAWSYIEYVWDTIGQPVFDLIVSISGTVRDTFAQYMPEIKEFVSQCFTDIGEFWNNNLKPCLDAIGNFIKNVLAPIFEAIFNERIKGAVENAFTFIKSLWNDTLKPVFTGITDFLTGVFTLNFEQAWNGIKSFMKGIVNGIINGIETMINGAISALNGLISGINTAISLAGSLLGLNISIPTISKLKLPRLEEGGILEKGQVGLLEGNGAEAVVPLDKNRAWISAVAKDMENAVGGSGASKLLEQILEAVRSMDDGLSEKMIDAFATMKMEFNKREVARMVKAVN